MYMSSDAIDAYSIATLAGYVSGAGPVLTFARIAPIASGIGWALTWLAGERLFIRSLTAAQNLIYIFASIRRRLDWAIDCDHSYNDHLCIELLRPNISHGKAQHQPDNNWPAQQFNKYAIRKLSHYTNISNWIPNVWYFEDPTIMGKFSIEFPVFSLTIAHISIWLILFLIVKKYGTNPGWFLARFCLLLPLTLYTILICCLTIFGFSFSKSNEREISPENIEKYPFQYFSEIHGFFRTTIALVDYSSTFTGILIFASSRINPGNMPMNALALLTAQLLPPTFFYVLKDGCNGHLANIQPAYDSYAATANLLYTCIGPMVVLLIFIYNSFVEQFAFVERFRTLLLTLLCIVFATTGLLLCMPMGTSFSTLLQYVSQSSITQLFLFISVFFIYGWYNLDSDIRIMTNINNNRSLTIFLFGATSPLYTILLFTSVPAFLVAKLVSVFDLLMNGMDIEKHIDYGTAFISSSKILNRFFGYLILFGPTVIIIIFAFVAFYINVILYRMPWGAIMDATTDWISHTSLRQTTNPKLAPISHRIFTSFFKISYRTTLYFIFIIEIFIGIVLFFLFIGNVFYIRLANNNNTNMAAAGNFRTVLFLGLLTFHILSLIELRWALKRWDHSSRLTLYIAVATIEMAFLNGYMFVAGVNHSWGLDYQPFLVIFINTIIRGIMIAIVIAIRWNMMEMSHPTRTRDATEIYDATGDLDNDIEHDDDIPTIYEMRRDIFT
ncbi:Sodium- and chloride-dependent GABA transporter [Dirofilaria immitis]